MFLQVSTNGFLDPPTNSMPILVTNLVNWIPIYTNVGSFIFTDPKATNYPDRFYRDLTLP
jgi:hypothetical protein